MEKLDSVQFGRLYVYFHQKLLYSMRLKLNYNNYTMYLK
jgi:hypothetical protein